MLDLAVVLLLVLLNGVFALSELAVVSARRSRLIASSWGVSYSASSATPPRRYRRVRG
jgi:putative hemolysin